MLLEKPNRISLRLLIIAAFFQVVSIVLDQAIIETDGRLQTLSHRLENNTNLLDDLNFKSALVVKEWDSLHAALDRIALAGPQAQSEYATQLAFSKNLLKFTTTFSVNPTLTGVYHTELQAISELAQPALLSPNDELGASFESLDSTLFAVSRSIIELIDTIHAETTASEATEARWMLNRHVMLLSSVAFQLLGLLMLVAFFLVQLVRQPTDSPNTEVSTDE